MKKMSVVFVLILFTVIVTGCTNSMLENEETGNLGPAWNTTMKLPVADSSNNFGDLVDITEFDKFGYKVIEETGENELKFFITGTEEKPIQKSQSISLPNLKVDRTDPLFNFNTQDENLEPIPIVPDTELNETIPVPFPLPGIKFASNATARENNLGIKVINVGSNNLESFKVVVKTEDGVKLDEVNFSDINTDSSNTKNIDLSGNKIDSDQLNMELSHNQSGGINNSTEVHLEIIGPIDMSIEKVEGLDADTISLSEVLNTKVELGELAEVKANNENEYAKIDLKISPPSSSNINFDFHNDPNNNITLGGIELNYKDEKDIYTTGEQSIITLDTLELNGGVDFSGDTFSYNANDELSMNISIIGQNEVPVSDFVDTTDMPFVVEGNDLVYKMEGKQVEITQDQVDNINKYILSDNSYLKTEVVNGLPVGIQADIYLGTSSSDSITKNDLYTSENKVNTSSLIEINGTDEESISSENKFILGGQNGEEGLLNKIDDAVESEKNIFIGFKFKLGDIETDEFDSGEKSYSFSDDQTIETKAHLGITVKVNQ